MDNKEFMNFMMTKLHHQKMISDGKSDVEIDNYLSSRFWSDQPIEVLETQGEVKCS